MIATNNETGAESVTLPIRRAVVTFTNRAGKSESVTLSLTPTTNETDAVESARVAIAGTLLTSAENVRVGDKDGNVYPVIVAPVSTPSASFTLE